MNETQTRQAEAARIRKALAENPGSVVQMDCFDEQDARELMAQLTSEEKARCRFLWKAPRPLVNSWDRS